ncbi:MAG: superoxide dismutase [Phycisphaerales bacterium]|nr:superoxide dismutase [Phycisphaerales bacterium]
MPHEIPNLPYDFNALEPFIDEQTMRIHHGKHHQTYVTNLNKALEGHADLAAKSIEDLLAGISLVPENIRTAVNNHGGGHLNHSIFWTTLASAGNGGGGEPVGELGKLINSTFGGYDRFKEQFAANAAGLFGSGWAWLCLDKNHSLCIRSFPNQNSPVCEGYRPLVGLDVWEHAYYLKYQNRRPDYIAAWWNIVNWDEVARRYDLLK